MASEEKLKHQLPFRCLFISFRKLTRPMFSTRISSWTLSCCRDRKNLKILKDENRVSEKNDTRTLKQRNANQDFNAYEVLTRLDYQPLIWRILGSKA